MLNIMINVNWAALLPQIEERLNEVIAEGYSPEEFEKAMTDPHNWTESAFFAGQEFNYEGARFTLTQLCNIVELLTGSDTAFAEALRKRIIVQWAAVVFS